MRLEERAGPSRMAVSRADQTEAAEEHRRRRWRLDNLPAQGEKARAELWMARRTASTEGAVGKTWRMVERVFRWWMRTREAAEVRAEAMAAARIAPAEAVAQPAVGRREQMEARSEALALGEVRRLAGMRAVAAEACDRVRRCLRGLRVAWAARVRAQWRGKYPPAGPRPARPPAAAVQEALLALGLAEVPGSDGQAKAAAVALVRRALGAASGAVGEWDGRWVRRWVREVTGARAALAAEVMVRPPTAQERSGERALQEREEVARRARGLRRQEDERAREETRSLNLPEPLTAT